ncbi:MAG: hypothetical protein JNM35_14600 [Nitrospira sp.]|nr:hypothetical protein [Nitrospira sp.]MCS6265847.1 hypothetical protein [Nitrospira sp.]
MASSMKELLLSVHGIEMTFTTNSSELAHSVEALLHHFHCDTVAAHPMRMEFDAIARREDVPVRISGSAQLLHGGSGLVIGPDRQTTWSCDIYSNNGLLIADFHEDGLVVLDGVSQSAHGYLVRPEAMAPDIRVSFVHFAMTELLKRRGLYTFHATALEHKGQGVLIPGFSGRGKTTSFLSLLRAGYRYLSDDHPFFRVNGTRVEILPYPLKINVTDHTVSFFPELREAPPSVLHAGVPKRYFHAEDLYPGPLGQPCEPSVILFPEVLDSSHSCLEPLSKKVALEMILPHSLLVYDAEVARREFQALVRLVEQTDCYRLHFGRDVLELPWLVTPLLEKRQARREN